MAKEHGKTVSIYLDAKALETLETIKASGQNLSQVVSGALTHAARPNFAGEFHAFGYNYDQNMANMSRDDDTYRVEKWITEDVTRVFLMGTTLYGALLEDNGKGVKQVWKDLLEKNIKMMVLIQNIGAEGFDINALSKLKGEPVDILKAHSEAVVEHFSGLAQQHQNLEVRTSDTLITSSLLLAFRKGPQKISGQIHPYSGLPNEGMHFSFNVGPGQSFNETPFARLWQKAKPLK